MLWFLAMVILGGAAVACWLGCSLLAQNGRMLFRLEALERELMLLRLQSAPQVANSVHKMPGADLPPLLAPIEAESGELVDPLAKSRIARSGLGVDTIGPALTLPRLDGNSFASLSDYLGRQVLLVIVSPDCDPCATLLNELARQFSPADAESLLIVSRGETDANHVKFGRFPYTRQVVLQNAWEISRRYATFQLPSAYWINANGRTVEPVAVGAKNALALALRVRSAIRESVANVVGTVRTTT